MQSQNSPVNKTPEQLDNERLQQLQAAAMQAEWGRRFTTYIQEPYTKKVKPFFGAAIALVVGGVAWSLENAGSAWGYVKLGWKNANPKISKEQHLEGLVEKIGTQPTKSDIFQKHYYSWAPTVRKATIMTFGLYNALVKGSGFSVMTTLGPELYIQRDAISSIPAAYQKQWQKHSGRFLAAHLLVLSAAMFMLYRHISRELAPEDSMNELEPVLDNSRALILMYFPTCSRDYLEKAICRPMSFPEDAPVEEAVAWLPWIKSVANVAPSTLLDTVKAVPGGIKDGLVLSAEAGVTMLGKAAGWGWTLFIEKTVYSTAASLCVALIRSLPEYRKGPLTPQQYAEKQLSEYEAAKEAYNAAMPKVEAYHSAEQRALVEFQKAKAEKKLVMIEEKLKSPQSIIQLLEAGVMKQRVSEIVALEEKKLAPVVLKECERLSTTKGIAEPVVKLKKALRVFDGLDQTAATKFRDNFKKKVASNGNGLFNHAQAANVLGIKKEALGALKREQMLAQANGVKLKMSGVGT